MNWKSALAIYVLFWAFSVFLVLPFAARPANEEGAEMVPGQAPSAPVTFDAKKVAIRVTIVATSLWALFMLNYIFGWVTPDMLDWTQ